MLLLDSNIFLYARGNHSHSAACRSLIASADEHPDWVVPLIVMSEVTHYLADAGEYARRIGAVFSVEPTTIDDFEWAAASATEHSDFNDHVILHVASRLGARGVVSYDRFFDRQEYFPEIDRRTP